MKKILFLAISLMHISSYSQINFSDKSQVPKIKAVKYDGSFMNFNDMMLTEEKKAGVVGEKVTLFKAWSIKNEDGTSVSYSDSHKFENKTFEIIEYIYEYQDIVKIKNEDGVFLFKPSSIDEYVFNRYIDTIKSKLTNKVLIPLQLISAIKPLVNEEIQLDGLKEYKITKVTFAKTSLGFGITVELNNDFEVIYPNGSFEQEEEKGWVNLESGDIFKSKITFIEKEVFLKFASYNKLYLNDIRNGKVKVGMTEKQCRIAFGMPTSAMKNFAGYDTVLIYGNAGYSKNLYFNKGVLKLVK